jgi:hypothetical protein
VKTVGGMEMMKVIVSCSWNSVYVYV